MGEIIWRPCIPFGVRKLTGSQIDKQSYRKNEGYVSCGTSEVSYFLPNLRGTN